MATTMDTGYRVAQGEGAVARETRVPVRGLGNSCRLG